MDMGRLSYTNSPLAQQSSRAVLVLISLLQPDLPSSVSSVFCFPVAVAWSGLSLNSQEWLGAWRGQQSSSHWFQ